ncbi:hypothetical protein C791_5359 [Amycolatopsis azurea DSM 43854]|uniref:Uncharacterized protein n=1 Tax=Amycolatopsis azurea DSM 43854 TaxID=1238180 RepID=M2PZ95_9PSEU|nr:hypothetical protein C791_5359 [Amycolatopsis azurea DSM 43854]
MCAAAEDRDVLAQGLSPFTSLTDYVHTLARSGAFTERKRPER